MILLLPRLRPDQYAIASHPAKVKVIAMGRRWGKTMMAGSLALTHSAGGRAIAWVVPTYRNARPVWRHVRQLARGIGDVRDSDMSVRWPTGGMLEVFTGENDIALRGNAFDGIIIDEAARIHEETWADVIMPTLADRDGWAMLISTPKGRNWFWREYQRGLGDGKLQASFTAPSSANPLPNIRAAAEKARQYVSERTYRQEWLAEFVDDGGGVFRRVREAATAVPLAAGEPGRDYVIGVDWGRTDDATVFCVLDTERLHVAAMDRMTQTDYGLQLARLKGLAERFGGARILAELNSMGGPQVEQAQREGLSITGFNTTASSKAGVIDSLALAFERGDLRILPDPVSLAELEAYESQRLPGGTVRYSAPAGQHDDCVIALALALRAARGAGVGYMEV